MGLVTDFIKAVRNAVGLPEDPGSPPDLIRLGLYPARVDACSSDGKTCDVTPADKRISPEKNVEVLVGIPGATAVVEPQAVVLLGWRRGDPASPFCMPAWAIGATVDKLTLNATILELAGNTYSIPQWENFSTAMVTWVTAMQTMINALVPTTGIAPAAQTPAATACGTMLGLLNGATFKSQKVKNG